MTTYNWEFGSLDAAVHFTVSYDPAIGSFSVFCDKGSFNLGALWFSDGDSTKDFSTLLTKSDNSLNMNGTSTVWSNDGTTTQEKIVWDDYAKPLSSTIISAGNTVGVTLSTTDQIELSAFLAQLSNPENFTLGVRSTSVNGTSDGFKWADTNPEVVTNQAPTAHNDTLTATEDTSITYTAAQLLGNDTDDGSHDALYIQSVTSGPGGTAVLNGDGSVTFTPNADFSGLANFTYTVSDGSLSSSATVNVTVNAVSDTPTLSVTPASGDEDTPIALTINPALTDLDGSETLSVTISGIPAGATLSNTAGDTLTISAGSITLTPAQLTGLAITPPSNSAEDFQLTVLATATDGAATPASSAPVFLDVTVNPVSDTPTLSVTPASGNEDTPIALTINPALTDLDGSETLSVTISGIPAGASLSNTAGDTLTISAGSITLTPAQLTGLAITPPSNSAEDFQLTVLATATDGTATPASSAPVFLDVTVNPVSDTPTLSVTPASGDEDTAIALTINPALTDLDGSETLSVTISGIPAGATLSNTAGDTLTISAGSITLAPAQLTGLAITPPSNSAEDFQLTVLATATDGAATPASSAPVFLDVTVNPVSDTPTLSVTPASGDEDTAIALTINPALTDLDGSETLSVTISGIPAGASLSAGTLNPDGSVTLTPAQLAGLTITPPSNIYGNFTLTVTAISTDGLATPATTVNIINMTVNPVNDAPVAVADTLWISDSQTITLPVSVLLGNDTDIDGKAITFQSVAESNANIDSVTFNSATQTFTLELLNNATTGHAGTVADPGLATFTYVISDNASSPLTSTGTVTIKIVDVTSGADPFDISAQSYQGSYINSVGGADTLTGAISGDVLIGGAGNDILSGGNGNDILQGGGNTGNGIDVLDGGAGTDLLDYSTMNSNFNFTLAAGGNGASSVDGADTYSNIEGVIGGSGNNTLTGNTSDNVLIGGGGTDILSGLEGNDILRGGIGNNDRMDGGTGTDLLDFSDGSVAINFTLQQGTAAGSGYYSIANGTGGLGDGDGYRNMEGVVGTNLNDNITGSSLNDILMGGAGNDSLHGSDGNDILIGGAGADTLEGGSGSGSDTFTFLKGDAASVDTISDFTSGAGGDSLDISSVLSDSGVTTGTLANYVSVREYNGNTIVSVDADAGGVASAQDIAILTNVTGVTLEDLNLVLPPSP